jgi:hypothetical protein
MNKLLEQKIKMMEMATIWLLIFTVFQFGMLMCLLMQTGVLNLGP